MAGEEGEDDERKNIAKRGVTPKRVRLPNRQSSLARYDRVNRGNLPRNVTTTRTKKIGPKNKCTRKVQKGGSMLGQIAKWGTKLGAKFLFKKGVSKVSKALSSEIGKKTDRRRDKTRS